MSDATPTPAPLAGYIERLFATEDDVLRELREAMRERGFPEIQVTPEVGRLLQVLLVAVGARRVVEIGTLGGYSAIWMARALPADGRLVSIEIDPGRAALAREFIARAGLDRVAEILVGPAADVLPTLDSEPLFDACFIDADKEGYPAYLDWARRRVRPGGLILIDNALWKSRVLDPAGDEDSEAVDATNRLLAAAPDLDATIVALRDGLAIAVVRGQTG